MNLNPHCETIRISKPNTSSVPPHVLFSFFGGSLTKQKNGLNVWVGEFTIPDAPWEYLLTFPLVHVAMFHYM